MKTKFLVIYFVFSFLFCLNTILGLSINKKAYADDIISCTAESAILVDYNSGTVIFSKNEFERKPIASMCKIMTLIICYDNIKLGNISYEDEVCVSSNASSMGGSQVFLETNGVYKVKDLLKSISIASANDSCVAMAEKLYGSEQAFVEQMNYKSKELGLENTAFSNCTGLPKPDQYSCASDVAKMFSELISNKDYFEISSIWMEDFHHPKGRITTMSNTNKLIKFYDGCDSGKTGFTSDAGHCLTASAMRNGMRLIAVEIHAPDSKTRFKEVSEMFNYGFANFTNKLIIDCEKPLDLAVEVKFGKKNKVSVLSEKSIYVFMNKNQKRSFEIDFVPKNDIIAPIYKGDCLGKILILENGVEIDSANVISAEDVIEKSFFDILCDISLNWSIL